MNLQELQSLLRLGSILQWLAIILVLLAVTFQVTKCAIDEKVDSIREQIAKEKAAQYEQTIGELKGRIDAQVEHLKAVLVQEKARTIPKHLLPKIIAELSKYRESSVLLNSLRRDSEALAFAQELKWIFEEAGWRVSGVNEVQYAVAVKNIVIVLNNATQKSKANYLFSLFKALDYESSARLNQNQQQDIAILVGSRG